MTRRCEDYHADTVAIEIGPLETPYGAWVDDCEHRHQSGERQVKCPCCGKWLWASTYHHFPVPTRYEHRGGGHWVAAPEDPDVPLPTSLYRVEHRALEAMNGGLREMALCEYNPTTHGPAYNPPVRGDCPNEATISVGAKANWHLCDSCAGLDEFKRTKKAKLKSRVEDRR